MSTRGPRPRSAALRPGRSDGLPGRRRAAAPRCRIVLGRRRAPRTYAVVPGAADRPAHRMSDASGIRRNNAATVRSRLDPADKARIGIGAVVIGPVAVGGLRRRPIPSGRGRRARPPRALVLLAPGSAAFCRAASLSAASAAAATAASSASAFPAAGFRGAGLPARGLPRDGPSRPRGARRRLRLLPRRAGRRLCLLGLLLGRLGLGAFAARSSASARLRFRAFSGVRPAAGPGSSVFGLGVVVAGIIIGVAGLSGSAGRGGGIGAVATGSSAAPDGAVPTSIAAKTAGKKIRATWSIGDPSRAERGTREHELFGPATTKFPRCSPCPAIRRR